MPVQLKSKVTVKMNGRELHLATTKAARAVLARAAGRLRIQARRSLKAVSGRRARKNPSKPGEPPHSIRDKKTGHRMRLILYAQRQPMEWVIGPMLLASRHQSNSNPTPAVHEHGGSKVKTTYTVKKQKSRTTARQRRAFREKVRSGEIKYSYKELAREGRATRSVRRISYPKRPFMQPALARLAPQIPAMFANKIKK